MMKPSRLFLIFLTLLAVSVATAQGPNKFTKTDSFDFGAGGSISITGAPNGSIRVVGGPKAEVEIVAEVEVSGANGAELAKLAAATGFVETHDNIRATILTVGSHNKFGLKKLPKDFPKNLLTASYRVNYTITVPAYIDLEIEAGRGDLSVIGVEGALHVNAIESRANVEIIGGNIAITIGIGSADISFGSKGIRARSVDVQVARGDVNVWFPANASANIDATVLRSGTIANLTTDLKPRDRKIAFTDKSLAAKVGVGGPLLKFIVTEGTITLNSKP